MTEARNLYTPMPVQICNGDGTLTAQGQAFLRRLWERTGYASGVSMSWIAMGADAAFISASQARASAAQALQEAQEAMDTAQQILLDAQVIRAQALKALEMAQDYAIITATAQANPRDGSNSNESMVFSIMKP